MWYLYIYWHERDLHQQSRFGAEGTLHFPDPDSGWKFVYHRINGFRRLWMSCCCQMKPLMDMQPTAEKQLRSPIGCCSGVAQKPCDMQSTPFSELPDVVSAYSGEFYPDAFCLTVVLVKTFGGRINSGDDSIFLTSDPKFRSPPLYLQKLSFLIWSLMVDAMSARSHEL